MPDIYRTGTDLSPGPAMAAGQQPDRAPPACLRGPRTLDILDGYEDMDRKFGYAIDWGWFCLLKRFLAAGKLISLVGNFWPHQFILPIPW
jgi:hypothetical protein